MTQPGKSYYRVMLGRQSAHVAEYLVGGFIGADFGIEQDLSGQFQRSGATSTPPLSRCSWRVALTRARLRRAWLASAFTATK